MALKMANTLIKIAEKLRRENSIITVGTCKGIKRESSKEETNG
jgi:hypothetical protein